MTAMGEDRGVGPGARADGGDPPRFVAAGDANEQLRDAPTEPFIAAMRTAFPTEAEYDRVLTRKLRRRASGPHVMPTREEMTDRVQAFLSETLPGEFQIGDGHWLAGGASKIQFGFTLRSGGRPEHLVVRMEPSESLNATSRRREFQLLRAMDGVVPVPRTPWVDADAQWFPEPAIIYAFAVGVSRPSDDRARVSGTGTVFGPRLRAQLGRQFVEHLAAVHTHEWAEDALDAFDVPRVGSAESAVWQMGRARRVWEEDRGQEFPAVEVVTAWLADHAPALDRVSVVHGDFRSGNFLFDEDRAEITAWLDWERGYLGDRHRDLAWTTTELFGTRTAGGDLLVCGLVEEHDFYDRYRRVSGLEVDPERLFYYQVLNAWQLVISNLATAHRVVRLAKSHQDVVLAYVEAAVYPIADQMLRLLKRGPVDV